MQRRTVDVKCLLLVLGLVLAAGCGGNGAPATDADAVAKVLKDAAGAIANRDGDKACSYLTPEAQRQAILTVGVAQAFGNVDCPTFVSRATAFLSPLDKKRIESLEPMNVTVNGAAASATMAAQGTSVQLNLQKVGDEWKIAGFANAVGLPGG